MLSFVYKLLLKILNIKHNNNLYLNDQKKISVLTV